MSLSGLRNFNSNNFSIVTETRNIKVIFAENPQIKKQFQNKNIDINSVLIRIKVGYRWKPDLSQIN